MKTFKVKLDIFDTWLTFYYDCDQKDISDKVFKYTKLELELDSAMNACFFVAEPDDYDNDGLMFGIWINNFDGSIKSIGILSHECLHAITWLLRRKGVKYNRYTEEVYCYMHQYVFESAMKKLKNILT